MRSGSIRDNRDSRDTGETSSQASRTVTGLTPEQVRIAEEAGLDVANLSPTEQAMIVNEIERQQAASHPGDADDYRAPSYVTSTGEGRQEFAQPVYGPNVDPSPSTAGPYDGDIEQVYGKATQYSDQSSRLILNDMNASEIAALEVQMMNAGIFSDDYTPTQQRSSLMSGFSQLIIRADQNRVSWEKQLQGDINFYQQWLVDNPAPGKAPYPAFVAPDYMKPDYATLAQRTKATLRQGLGRDATTSEMKILTQFLGAADKDEWEANTYDPAYGEWQKGARAYETGENQTSQTYQEVDSVNRFNEYFEDRYEGELEHREQVDRQQRKSGGLFASLDTLTRMTQ